jgi:hypothetical protein
VLPLTISYSLSGGELDERQVVRVWMTRPMWTEPFHDAGVPAPVEGPGPHVMVARVMDATARFPVG